MNSRLLLLCCSILATTSAFCQTDSIYLHSGRVIGGTVKEAGAKTITYMPGEAKAIKSISKRAVQKIIYSSGKEDSISPVLTVNTADEWEKVVVLDDQADVAGLQYAGEVAGVGGGKFVDSASAEKQSLTELRKAAARLRCPFVYIADNHVRNVGYVGRRVRKSGVVYKY